MARAIVNGQRVETISVFDRGLQFGDGLFETLAVSSGQPLLLQWHLERLAQGCTQLGIEPPDWDRLGQEIEDLAKSADCAVLKLVLTRGESLRGYQIPASLRPNRILYLADWPSWLTSERYQSGIAARICQHRLSENPRLAGIKHLNRLDQVLARAEWPADELSEGLMLDQSGQVIEGVSSNVFIFSDGKLMTPELNHCGVAGVMRRLVLERFDSEVRSLSLDEVLQAEAVYLTNSVIGVLPVCSLQGRNYAPEAWLEAPLMRLNQELGLC